MELEEFIRSSMLQIMRGIKGALLSKFYTDCSRVRAAWSSLFLLTNQQRARRDSTPKIAYTNLP
jgi:hypothetical protein